MPKTTIKAKTVDLGELELGDKLYVVLELEVMDEGRRRNGTAGTVDYRGAVIKDVLRLAGALPTELADELRRQRREAEEEATGIPVVPGLEGFLDAGGVVITEADREAPDSITREALEDDEVDAIARYCALGLEVHVLRVRLADEPDNRAELQHALDQLFIDLNAIAPEDEVVEDDAGIVIIDIEGEARDALELPDLVVDVAGPALDDLPEPIDGYEALDFDGIVAYVDEYLAADRALGGDKPSAKALEHLEKLAAYERNYGARGAVLNALGDRIKIIATELAQPGAPVESSEGLGVAAEVDSPWDTYDKDTADTIIGRLRNVAETDVDEARRLIALVDAYETSHKNRKGVLNRTGGLVPPPLPTGPDDDLNLDEKDDLLDALDRVAEDAVDEEIEP